MALSAFILCDNLSYNLREERRLWCLNNRVLGRVFGCTWKKVTGKWIRLHNEKLYALFFSPSIIRLIISSEMNETGRACGTYGEEKRCRGFW
jgi:hypothetical protein